MLCIAGVLYAVGGIELGVGAIMLISEDPQLNPRMLLIAGVCFLAGAKLVDRMVPAKAVRR